MARSRQSSAKPQQLRLTRNHGWKAAPGHKILVLDRGAVRVDYPASWFMEMTDDCIKLHDRKPPDDDFAFGFSYHRWPTMAAAQIPVANLVRSGMEGDPRAFTSVSEAVTEMRIDTALAWADGYFIDPIGRREACGRFCIARRTGIQALITLDFWVSDRAMCDEHWRAILASLQVARWIEDIDKGPVYS